MLEPFAMSKPALNPSMTDMLLRTALLTALLCLLSTPAIAQFNIYALNSMVFGLMPTVTPITGGTGYSVNDTITLDCPNTTTYSYSGAVHPILTVNSVSSGAVTSVTVTAAGQNNNIPSSGLPTTPNGICTFTQLSTSGSGSGATFLGTFGFLTPINPSIGNLQIVNGGTGGTTAAAALINLGALHGIDPRSAPYNAKCDGITDDTAAFHNAAAAALAQGVFEIMPPAVCYVGASGDAILASLIGSALYGDVTSPTTSPGTLLLDPSHTIHFVSGSYVTRIRILRYGYVQPTTLRAGITAVNNFSGTGLTLDYNDVYLDHVHVQGFATPITKSGQRVDLSYVEVDGTNGFISTACFDSCMSHDLEAWEFSTNSSHLTPTTQLTNISNIVSNGGLCQISFASAPATPIITGDTVIINASTAGVTGCSGRFTSTAIDNQNFTLNGSTFGGSYTTGGTAFITANRRTGVAFASTGASGSAEWVTNFIEYGWDGSVLFGGGSSNRIQGLWTDGPTDLGAYSDPIPTGILVNGTSSDNIIAHTELLAKTNSIKVSSAGRATLTMSDAIVGVLGGGYAGVTGSGLSVATGATVKLSNIELATAGTYGTESLAWASIATNTNVYLSNLHYNTGVSPTISFGGTACGTTFLDGTAGPCTYTPGVYGNTSGIGVQPTYTTQDGQFTVTSGGIVTSWVSITASQTLTAASVTGNILISMPVSVGAAGSNAATCSISRLAGFTATTNYNTLTAAVYPNTQSAQLTQISNLNGNNTINAPVSNFPGVMGIALFCTYHE